MKRGDSVRLTNGKDKGIVLLSPTEVDELTMCCVSWGDYRFTWERVKDLILC